MHRDDTETEAVERRGAGGVDGDAWDDRAREDEERDGEIGASGDGDSREESLRGYGLQSDEPLGEEALSDELQGDDALGDEPLGVESRDEEPRDLESQGADGWDGEARTAGVRDPEDGIPETTYAETADAEVEADAAEAETAAPEDDEVDAGVYDIEADKSFGTGSPAEHHDLPASPAADGDPLIAPDQEHQFLERWSRAQIGFVDDPHRAVSEAESLLEEIVTAQREALEARRSEMAGQCHGSGADTEDLRLAMRGYGQLVSSLLSHAG